MTTRQNTRPHRGRGGGPPRERTYTTLTNFSIPTAVNGGPGPATFLTATTASAVDDPSAANNSIMSSPFSVASSADGSPKYKLYDFSNPAHAYTPYHHGVASMQPGAASGTYGQQQSLQQPPQFYTPPAPPPPGQNDLELLERLKEVIKNNQHDIFRPIPQPAALASLIIGSSTAATHPEQGPGDRQLGQNEYDSSRGVGTNNNGVSQGRGRRDSEGWDGSRRPGGYSQSGNGASPATNVLLCSHYMRKNCP